ncbi:MAG: 16S rRNA (guanine(966)-N(2))-methyltransferase RsmD [Methylococcales bacterium]
MKNQIRIIGGRYRSRLLSFSSEPGLRPTPGRVRETLFNWLQHDISDSLCLDLFAGSGALGLEAASRGAERVVQVEENYKVCKIIKQNVLNLGTEKVEVVRADVMKFLSNESQSFHLVFLDPPFGEGLIPACCQLLEQKGWLNQEAKIYIESEKGLDIVGLPESWECLQSKKTDEVGYHLFQRGGG